MNAHGKLNLLHSGKLNSLANRNDNIEQSASTIPTTLLTSFSHLVIFLYNLLERLATLLIWIMQTEKKRVNFDANVMLNAKKCPFQMENLNQPYAMDETHSA